jgi:lysophospholipase L1-like esterase
MNKTFCLMLAGAVAVGVAFPAAAPGAAHVLPLRVAMEPSCGVAQAVPVRVGPLPRFAAALAGRARLRIVAIGSSSTQGIGASRPGAAYPAQLQEMLQAGLPREQVEVLNLGVGGEAAAQTAERLRRDVPALAPDLILWQVGTNDGLKGVAPEDYAQTLAETLQFLKTQRVDVVLVGMQWTRQLAANANYMAVRAATARVAAQQGVPLVSRFDAMKHVAELSGREDQIGPDLLHPNDQGYRCMAQQVAFTLARAVGGESRPKM